MSKGLKAWETIKNNYLLHNELIGDEIDIIEKELKDCEDLLPFIDGFKSGELIVVRLEDEIIHRKKVRALEIIKNKRIDIEYIKCCETYEQYQTICSYWNELTQADFDLLKEVLQ